MSAGVHFAPGTARLLRSLDAQLSKNNTASFPTGWDSAKATAPRVDDPQTVHAAFQHLVNNCGNGQPEQLALLPSQRVVVTAEVRRIGGRQKCLDYISCQVFAVSGCALADLYLSPQPVEQGLAHYHRLDFDPHGPGRFLAEPVPHIHGFAGDISRFPFTWRREVSVLVEFIEFLVLNFDHDVWVEWADRNWSQRPPRTQQGADLFPSLRVAFEQGCLPQNPTLLKAFENMRASLARAKKDQFDWQDTDLANALSYPVAI